MAKIETRPKSLIDMYLDIERSLDRTVKIRSHEVDKLVVSELIVRRNSKCGDELKEAFDKILRAYYLSEDEFEKYVIKGKKIS